MKKIITDNIGLFVLAALAVALAALAISLKDRKQLNPPANRPAAADTTSPAAGTPAAGTPAVENPAAE